MTFYYHPNPAPATPTTTNSQVRFCKQASLRQRNKGNIQILCNPLRGRGRGHQKDHKRLRRGKGGAPKDNIGSRSQWGEALQQKWAKLKVLIKKNYCNGGVWQSRISKSLAEYVNLSVCFVNVQSSLHENVIFSVCARMDNAAYIIIIMWNSISG